MCCVFADGPSGLHRYKLRLLFDAVEMRWDWPVDVNYHEAQVRRNMFLTFVSTMCVTAWQLDLGNSSNPVLKQHFLRQEIMYKVQVSPGIEAGNCV